MSQPYDSLPNAVSLNDTLPERKRSLSMSSVGSGSDISYNDPLDVEPFSEKRLDSRFQDEPALEDGDEGSRFLGSRRVCSFILELRLWLGGADKSAATPETVQEDFGGFSWDITVRRSHWGIICLYICWAVLLGGTRE